MCITIPISFHPFINHFIILTKPLTDKHTQLLRDCGRLYTERIQLDADVAQMEKDMEKDGGNEKEYKRMLGRFIEIFTRMAQTYRCVLGHPEN
jgi:hypothetical protein